MSDGDTAAIVQREQSLSLQRVSTAATVAMAATGLVQMWGAARPTGGLQMAHSIVKARQAHANMRRRIAQEVQQREHSFTAFCVAAGVGVYEAKNKALPTPMNGVDGTLIYGFASLLLGEQVGGRGGRILQSCADGLLSIAAYKHAKAMTLGKQVEQLSGMEIVGDAGADARAMDALLAAS